MVISGPAWGSWEALPAQSQLENPGNAWVTLSFPGASSVGSGRRGRSETERPQMRAQAWAPGRLQHSGPRGLCTVISCGSPEPLSPGCMSLWREGQDAKRVHRTKGRLRVVGAKALKPPHPFPPGKTCNSGPLCRTRWRALWVHQDPTPQGYRAWASQRTQRKWAQWERTSLSLLRPSQVLPCRISDPVVSDPKSLPNNVEIYYVKSPNSATLASHLNLLQNTSLAKENTSVDQAPAHLLCFTHTETLRPIIDPASDSLSFKLWRSLCRSSVWTLKILFYRLEAGQTFPQLHFYNWFPKPYGRDLWQNLHQPN